MLKDITEILKRTPGLKGREIAKQLDLNKKTVNSFLSKNHEGLYQDKEWKWYLTDIKTHKLILNCNSWVTAESFESDPIS